MKNYLRILAALYFLGALLHLADVLDLRLQLGQMGMTWKVWIWFLLVFDFAASIGLWLQTTWGQFLFLLVATSQLIAYLAFQNIFGSQAELVLFHILTLAIYGTFLFRQRKSQRTLPKKL